MLAPPRSRARDRRRRALARQALASREPLDGERRDEAQGPPSPDRHPHRPAAGGRGLRLGPRMSVRAGRGEQGRRPPRPSTAAKELVWRGRSRDHQGGPREAPQQIEAGGKVRTRRSTPAVQVQFDFRCPGPVNSRAASGPSRRPPTPRAMRLHLDRERDEPLLWEESVVLEPASPGPGAHRRAHADRGPRPGGPHRRRRRRVARRRRALEGRRCGRRGLLSGRHGPALQAGPGLHAVSAAGSLRGDHARRSHGDGASQPTRAQGRRSAASGTRSERGQRARRQEGQGPRQGAGGASRKWSSRRTSWARS